MASIVIAAHSDWMVFWLTRKQSQGRSLKVSKPEQWKWKRVFLRGRAHTTDLAPGSMAQGVNGTSWGLAVVPMVHPQAQHRAWEVGTDLPAGVTTATPSWDALHFCHCKDGKKWVISEEKLMWWVLMRLLNHQPNTWNIFRKFWQTIENCGPEEKGTCLSICLVQ